MPSGRKLAGLFASLSVVSAGLWQGVLSFPQFWAMFTIVGAASSVAAIAAGVASLNGEWPCRDCSAWSKAYDSLKGEHKSLADSIITARLIEKPADRKLESLR